MGDPADANLVPEQFQELNARFYRSAPHEYFMRRLHALMVTVGRPDLIHQALVEGVSVGTMKASSTGEFSPADEELQHYGITEAVVLLHHASEALLRLFFAHEHVPECPWLENARLRNPRDFKVRLKRLVEGIESPEQQDRIAKWFLGARVERLREREAEDGQAWLSALEGATRLLVHTAHRLSSEAGMYNAAKHGLAVLPSEVAMKLGDDNAPIDLSAEGPSLTFLERVNGPTGSPHWQETTSWVRLDSWLGWTYLVIRQMANLWSVAKLAYLDEPASLSPIFPAWVDSVLKVGAKTYNIETMSIQLAYYRVEADAQ